MPSDIHQIAASARSGPTGGAPRPEQAALLDALQSEYGLLSSMLTTVWAASLVLAGVIGGLATSSISASAGWGIGAIAFLVTVAAMLAYRSRSVASLHAAIRPLCPTPPDAIDAPI